MKQTPSIAVDVTFLTPKEGGREQIPDLSSGKYVPHLVVQNPGVRQPTVAGRTLTEDYLGVCFVSGPAEPTAGKPLRCTLALMYHPQVDYALLETGATFTIREGPSVVGFGTVLNDMKIEGVE